jgi:aspartyl-tRNA synthetase
MTNFFNPKAVSEILGSTSQGIIQAMVIPSKIPPELVQEFSQTQDGQRVLADLGQNPTVIKYNQDWISRFTHLQESDVHQLADEYNLEIGDSLLLQGQCEAYYSGGSTPLGRLRTALHKSAVAKSLLEKPSGFNFLWITDFPLFSPSTDGEPGQGGQAGLSSTHHPFTAPKKAMDVDLLDSDPQLATAAHYDLVVNGVELGGGSRRIHIAVVQEKILRDVLRMPEKRIEDFRHLLNVLSHGCPPHAGIALGFDRLVAVMLGLESVRDVIAFPKTGSGEDPLVKSPNVLTPEQLDTYHLRLK